IGNKDRSVRGGGDTERRVETRRHPHAVGETALPGQPDERRDGARGGDPANHMITDVRNIEVAIVSDGDSAWSIEPGLRAAAVIAAWHSGLAGERADQTICADFSNDMILAVGDEKISRGVCDDGGRIVE